MELFGRRSLGAGVLAIVAASVLTACGSSGGGGSRQDSALPLAVPHHVSVTTRRIAGLGEILVDGQGHTLYMFPPDASSRVSCTGACAGTWPPLVISGGEKATASSGVQAGLLSALADPNTGARIVTYNHHPLYRYAGDVRAGTADGQALFLNGGPWYVLDPAGIPVTVDTGADR